MDKTLWRGRGTSERAEALRNGEAFSAEETELLLHSLAERITKLEKAAVPSSMNKMVAASLSVIRGHIAKSDSVVLADLKDFSHYSNEEKDELNAHYSPIFERMTERMIAEGKTEEQRHMQYSTMEKVAGLRLDFEIENIVSGILNKEKAAQPSR